MKDAVEYLGYLRALILRTPEVRHWQVVREEAQGTGGLLRYRLELNNGDEVEVFERFEIVAGRPKATKYSFHWQNAAGQLRKRWDNAAHHPEVSTYPHHLHEGAVGLVLPHHPVNLEDLLGFLKEIPPQQS